MLDPTRLSATKLAALIRRGEVSSEAVVAAHIARIRAVNPRINAVVADRFDASLDEARAADARVRDARARSARAHSDGPDGLPTFHGVPFTVKESFALTGMPHTGGLVARRDLRATRDATVVARLRAAGAIPLGVTNVSELCMWMESANRVYGRTRNPYDPRRIPGGSSGGEGAIIGAGGSPFGVGADIGGSIRMPAFFGGVFGLKATGGRVPNTGAFPHPDPAAGRFHCTGPLARRAEDLMPLLRIMAGPDGEDPACAAMPLGDPAAVPIEGLRVLVVEDDGRHRVAPVLREALRRAARQLEARGAVLERARFAGFRDAFEIWSSMLASASEASFASLMGLERPHRLAAELLRWPFGRSPHTLPALGLAVLEKAFPSGAGRVQRAVEHGHALRAELARRIGPDGVLLYPPYPVPAPRHHTPLLVPVRWTYTAIMNVMELPVVQTPLGLDRRGLPLGVQIAALHGHDHVAVAAALELERAFGGWVPPRS